MVRPYIRQQSTDAVSTHEGCIQRVEVQIPLYRFSVAQVMLVHESLGTMA
jgi:hypothetical protein